LNYENDDSETTVPRSGTNGGWPGQLDDAALSLALLAAAPPNDTQAGAQLIPGSGPFPYLTTPVDTTDATTAGDPAACVVGTSRSVWYRFIPDVTSTYAISTCDGTGTTVSDTALGIYVPG
jgi:hypothetical protein